VFKYSKLLPVKLREDVVVKFGIGTTLLLEAKENIPKEQISVELINSCKNNLEWRPIKKKKKKKIKEG
jgi:hypothetical protein